MNHCPDCGAQVEFQDTEDDVATIHTKWHCPRCGTDWEETVSKGAEEVVLHISPVREGE